ncbi:MULTISPECIES: glycosytransferase [unclassified Mesorhizobium]|uniref:glycosytransferase n=1 Tax=unclassified Mesorhizobium TaxID=325217 RepID=UPI00112A26D7|nr:MULTISPECIES: glycosytransferase [unclassified Mesorhizobium]TPI56817.1 glycosytransferase [Mesorhizobium sp. B3-1-1]TPJ72046.1 glycosytransferase [Mesorhizobium sp. B2-6-7]TPJ88636.1 glycosytransferase [Mesorhizobium sp. B2-6-3]TPK03717.1 glycosytransferase [Mesorhizobium sp. B2-5-10]TPK14082.1 glycosytransferase [Mesorhizobium sp. B2-5-11]
MRLEKSVRVDNVPRVMWILNHTAARKFEIPMLRELGYEVFTPKIYPDDANFRSASVDYSEDKNLTIPPDDLAVLNKADWYRGAPRKAWEIANKYFDIMFCIVFDPKGFEIAARRFQGAMLWRTYGLAGNNTYSKIIETMPFYQGVYTAIQALGKRFWFTEGYPHLHKVEPDYLASKTVFLPLGMGGASDPISAEWNGGDRRILFICPDIGFNQAYVEIFQKFKKDFRGFPYAIGGAQSVKTTDPSVLGYLPIEEHRRNMREMRVMFYHSQEPNHIHFHPFEAIKAGMPLVFMGGGILDMFGGKKLPGRCATIEEARKKIDRILKDDWKLINKIRESQAVLLDPMKAENCTGFWRQGMEKVFTKLAESRADAEELEPLPKRIAVLTDKNSIAKARALALALEEGAKLANEDVEIVLTIERSKRAYSSKPIEKEEFDVPVREFSWRALDREAANRALVYAGAARPLTLNSYLIPDDGINHLQDCDLWVVVASEVSTPILPIRPIVLAPDTIAPRFRPGPQEIVKMGQFGLTLAPEAVIVDSQFASEELIHCEGVSARNVHVLPPLPTIEVAPALDVGEEAKAFVWVLHPLSIANIDRAAEALAIYYHEMSGKLKCNILLSEAYQTKLTDDDISNVKRNLTKAMRRWNIPRRRYSISELLSERQLRRVIKESAFLWRPGKLDSDITTITIARAFRKRVVAAHCPVLKEYAGNLGFNITWTDDEDPNSMAGNICEPARDHSLPLAPFKGREMSIEDCARDYWNVISECL